MNILAVDPGGTTGFSSWRNDEWHAWMEPYDEAIPSFHNRIELASKQPDGLDLVVFESFHITRRTLETKNKGAEIEFIGVGRYLSRCYGITFETQSPSDAFNFSTDAKLKALDWWVRGPDHANAASRHLLLALVRHKALDLAELAAKLR